MRGDAAKHHRTCSTATVVEPSVAGSVQKAASSKRVKGSVLLLGSGFLSMASLMGVYQLAALHAIRACMHLATGTVKAQLAALKPHMLGFDSLNRAELIPHAATHIVHKLVVMPQVLEVHWKGDQLWGTIEVLPTPSGMLLWELYSQVCKHVRM